MSLIVAVAAVLMLQEPTVVPDVVVSAPEANSVWCVRNPPRHGSRTRGAVCRTYAEWRAVAQAAHDQNDVVYRRRDPLLMDTRLQEESMVGSRRQLERARRARPPAVTP